MPSGRMGRCRAMTKTPVIPSTVPTNGVIPTGAKHTNHVIPTGAQAPNPVIPTGAKHLQPCHPDWSAAPPTLSSRLERKRNGGIYRSWYDAGQCQDSSTSLRFGRNDIGGWCGGNDIQVCHPERSASPHMSSRPSTMSSRLERQRNGGIYRSWYDAGQCQDSSTTLRFGRNDKWGGAVGMTYKSVIPSAASPKKTVSSRPPTVSSRLEHKPPTMSSRLERKRNGGIYCSWYDAGQCQDSSTTLRSGRNDTGGSVVGMTYKSVIPSAVPLHICHPAPQPCHPDWSTSPQPCHPDWSVSGMEGSTAVGTMGGVRGFLHYASLRSE